MLPIPADIFTEPGDVSPDGLANLGPLRHLAGVWQGQGGKRRHMDAVAFQTFDDLQIFGRKLRQLGFMVSSCLIMQGAKPVFDARDVDGPQRQLRWRISDFPVDLSLDRGAHPVFPIYDR